MPDEVRFLVFDPKCVEYTGLADLLPKTVPYIVAVLDELSELMWKAGKEIEPLVCRMAAIARKRHRLDDMKEASVAFKERGRWLTIIGAVMAGSLVVIAGELLVICIKL